MNRELFLSKIKETPRKVWDVVVIGGGATGLGTAVDSAARGFETALFEQSDFAKGTSSRSTKLVHGGVRYLAQGDVSLVLEALKERGLLMQNAPHLVSDRKFIIPVYEWWEGPFYAIGMKVYDKMAGKLGFGHSKRIDKEELIKAIPNLDDHGLKGGVIYYDGQFDDSRLAINLAQTIVDNGGIPINYTKVNGFKKDKTGIITGVTVTDIESGDMFEVNAKVVINATGVFADRVSRLDDPSAPNLIRPSQGVHLVLDKTFLQGDSAIMIPHTSDGRVLFAVPWHDKVIVGTTDTPLDNISLEPRALEEEIEFLLKTSAKYLKKDPTRKDVKSIFAGLRPLAVSPDSPNETKEISRNHQISVAKSGLITITGGKWTTYRKMGEDAIDKAILVGGLEDKKSVTANMPIHGYVKNFDAGEPLHYYGSDKEHIKNHILADNPKLGQKLHPNLPYIEAEVVWGARHEMAVSVEDILARRTRSLFLDAKASIEAAPKVAHIMKKELHKSRKWEKEEIKRFTELAQNYSLNTIEKRDSKY